MTRVVLVHGVRSNGVSSVYRLESHLQARGLDVVRADLPIRRAIQVRWVYRTDAAALAAMLIPGDVLIGHSYGAALSYIAATHVQTAAVFFFNGALDQDIDLSRMRGRPPTWCVYSRGDSIVWLSGLLPAHIFGRGGHSGLMDLGEDRNIEIGGGHSDVFVGRNAERWADFVADELAKIGR